MSANSMRDPDKSKSKYSNVLSARDFCEAVDNVGVVFSLTVHDEQQAFDGSILANVTIRGNENAIAITTDAEGRITPATHSITGVSIPRRIFLAIPQNTGVSTDLLRKATIEINSTKAMPGKSVFDDFRVSY